MSNNFTIAKVQLSQKQKDMHRFIWIIFAASFWVVACNNPVSSTNQTAKATTILTAKVKTLPGLPPIYEEFEDLAYIFQQQNDTTYVINFWSTWCAPCIKELPYFEELNQKYLGKKVKVILVSLDFPKQLETKLKPFLAEKKLQSTVLVLTDPDANSWVDLVNPEWSGAIPATVVYNNDKHQFHEKSFEDLAALEEIVLPFL